MYQYRSSIAPRSLSLTETQQHFTLEADGRKLSAGTHVHRRRPWWRYSRQAPQAVNHNRGILSSDRWHGSTMDPR